MLDNNMKFSFSLFFMVQINALLFIIHHSHQFILFTYYQLPISSLASLSPLLIIITIKLCPFPLLFFFN